MAEDFDFEAWAEQQTPEVRSAFAGTCAARALPAIAGYIRPDGFTENRFDLILCRAILTSMVRGAYSATDVSSARSAADTASRSADATAGFAGSTAFSAAGSAQSAASSAYSAASSVDSVAYSAGAAAGSNYSAARSAGSAARAAADSAYFAARAAASSAAKAGVRSLSTEPLWFGNDMPKGLRKMWSTLHKEWRHNGHMSFWIDWYEGLLEGRAPDWELWRRIAEIDSDKWDNGPEAVTAEIDRIKGELILERNPLSETLEWDAEQQVIVRQTAPAANVPLYNASLVALADAIDDAQAGNYLNNSSFVIRKLNRTLERHSDNPELVEMAAVACANSLRKSVEAGDFPDAPEIVALQETCETVALDIRAQHPNIAANRAARAEQKIRELSEDDKDKIAKFGEVLILSDDLQTDVSDDVALIAEPPSTANADERRDAISRTANRAIKVQKIMNTVIAAGAVAGACVGVYEFGKIVAEIVDVFRTILF